jgi:hypothetical protein
MVFHSILFERTEDSIRAETLEAPVFFTDLNLDQITDAITAGKQEYNLKPFFGSSGVAGNSTTYRSSRAPWTEPAIAVQVERQPLSQARNAKSQG